MITAFRMPLAAPPDDQLLRAIADGDLEALGALFDRYAPEVRRYLLRISMSAVDVDDLVQATFLEVMRAAQRFDAREPARPWLYGIALVMLRRHRRSVGRAFARMGAWASSSRDQPSPATPDEHLEGREAARRFERALSRLSPKKREAFVLVTLEGFSGEEAARALGIPVKTLWTRLHHARRELTTRMGVEPRQ